MGYYKDKNTDEVKIDELAADIVREVFSLYINGHGLVAIAKIMNSRGIKSPEYFFTPQSRSSANRDVQEVFVGANHSQKTYSE